MRKRTSKILSLLLADCTPQYKPLAIFDNLSVLVAYFPKFVRANKDWCKISSKGVTSAATRAAAPLTLGLSLLTVGGSN